VAHDNASKSSQGVGINVLLCEIHHIILSRCVSMSPLYALHKIMNSNSSGQNMVFLETYEIQFLKYGEFNCINYIHTIRYFILCSKETVCKYFLCVCVCVWGGGGGQVYYNTHSIFTLPE
jgi:hypothetical protein